MICSFVLTLSSLLTLAPQNNFNNNNIYFTKKSVDEEEQLSQILDYAKSNYNFENYDLTSDETDSILKKHLYDFNVNNHLIDNDEITILDSVLSFDSDFNYNSELENKFNYSETNLTSSFNTYTVLNNKFSLNVDIDVSGGQGRSNTNENQELLPIHAYNANEINCLANGEIYNKPFIGIKVSKDACISFYNTISKFLNRQAMYIHDNVKGHVSMIMEIIKTVTPVTFSVASKKLTTYFASMFSEFVTLFTSKDPVSFVIGIIISLVAIGCIAIMVKMYICGYLKRGFAIGWAIYSIWDWRFINE